MQPAGSSARGRTLIYAGVFLIALAMLMLEVLLTRIISVIGWYDLAFFVISLAMLGMSAGALLVFLRPSWFAAELVPARLAQGALGFAVLTPLCVALVLAQPLMPVRNFMNFVGLLQCGALLALPFLLAGVTLALALTRAGLAPSVVYGVDLIGAAFGCALVIPALGLLDAPSAALLAAAAAALAAAAFARAHAASARPALAVACALGVLSLANAQAAQPPLRPAFVKTHPEELAGYLYSRWNSYSRVTVEPLPDQPPVFWATGEMVPPSLLQPLEQRVIEIDGAAGTVMARFGSGPEEHGYLAYELTALVHELRPEGAAAVIGVGGGKDVLAAARARHSALVGIELNSLIVALHEDVMADFSGIASLPGVTLVHDEARSYLARDRGQYSVITLSLIDTWASTGTGAYSLSENGLYTVEAWTTFLRRLAPTGILAVSRWYYASNPGETARLLSLALAVGFQNGAASPRDHVVLLQNQTVATLWLSRAPFSAGDLERLRAIASERGFHVLMQPGALPEQPLLRALAAQPSQAALASWSSEQALDLTPPSDDRPFFFNMLKARDFWTDRAQIDQLDLPFLGNLQATQTLIYSILVSLLLTLAALLLPTLSRVHALRGLQAADAGAALGYFALIGLGFMFVEIGLLSRLNVFLGHPTLSLAVLLGGLILATGAGSLLSGRIDVVANRRWARLYPLLPALAVLAVTLLLPPLLRACEAAANPLRIALALGLLLPTAVGMGLCFPLGLRLCDAMEERSLGRSPALGPWLYGINGAFGVCASGLALATSIMWGISTTLLIGAACYALLPLATRRLSAPERQ